MCHQLLDQIMQSGASSPQLQPAVRAGIEGSNTLQQRSTRRSCHALAGRPEPPSATRNLLAGTHGVAHHPVWVCRLQLLRPQAAGRGSDLGRSKTRQTHNPVSTRPYTALPEAACVTCRLRECVTSQHLSYQQKQEHQEKTTTYGNSAAGANQQQTVISTHATPHQERALYNVAHTQYPMHWYTDIKAGTRHNNLCC